jgi:hypothetical protein
MGKHGNTHPRVERDHYPTPAWVTAALLEHVDVAGQVVWEPATGAGQMAKVLKAAGAARVYCSDIHQYGYQLDEKLDFVSEHKPKLARYDAIITNPAYGYRGKLITPFIKAGLRRLDQHGGVLALLLAVDCDSAVHRPPYFKDCPDFDSKIVLTRRIIWFARTDGKRPQPKENHAWYIWRRPRRGRPPIILYAANKHGED